MPLLCAHPSMFFASAVHKTSFVISNNLESFSELRDSLNSGRVHFPTYVCIQDTT